MPGGFAAIGAWENVVCAHVLRDVLGFVDGLGRGRTKWRRSEESLEGRFIQEARVRGFVQSPTGAWVRSMTSTAL